MGEFSRQVRPYKLIIGVQTSIIVMLLIVIAVFMSLQHTSSVTLMAPSAPPQAQLVPHITSKQTINTKRIPNPTLNNVAFPRQI